MTSTAHFRIDGVSELLDEFEKLVRDPAVSPVEAEMLLEEAIERLIAIELVDPLAPGRDHSNHGS